MGNEITTTKPKFSEILRGRLDDISVSDALPRDFNKALFVQNAVTLLNNTPQLQKYSKDKLCMGLLNAAYLGLSFTQTECWLIPYGDQLNFQISYKGLRKLAVTFGKGVESIFADVVREGDEFGMEIIDGKQSFNFKPLPFNDGRIVGAFAVACFDNGQILVERMSVAEIENTRQKTSKAKNSMPWQSFYGEMCKKTVLRRLCKQIELTFPNGAMEESFQNGEDADFREKERPKYEAHDIYAEAEDAEFEEVEDAAEETAEVDG